MDDLRRRYVGVLLTEEQYKVVARVAKEHGDCSMSAAVRFLVRMAIKQRALADELAGAEPEGVTR